MADNYLENKMEEHRHSSGRQAVKRVFRRAGVLSPGLHLEYPPMWVAILADTAPAAEPYVATLRGAGISVALCCCNGGREASVLAQKFGARLYPDSCETDSLISDLAKNGNNPTWIIDLCNNCGHKSISLSSNAEPIPAAILARELLFLIHPEHEKLLKSQTLFNIHD